jgi:murein L,D-transpeptidase YcbB/YkuD
MFWPWLTLILPLPRTALVHLLGCSLGVLLAGLPCAAAALRSQLPGTSQAAPPPEPLLFKPVSALIRLLLDTGGTRAADARRGLQAGPEVRALYGPGCAPAWTQPADSLNADATGALALLARAPEFGLPADYLTPGLLALRDSLRPRGSANFFFANRPEQLARLDVALSDAVLRFMRDLSRGRLRPFTPSAREKAAGPTGQSAAVLRQRLLQLALAQWLVRPAGPDSTAHQQQFEQAAVNLERWRWEAVPDSAYVLINLPAFELQVVSRELVRHRQRVVVGEPETPTPTLSSTISHFTLAPECHVPTSIATQKMLPRLKKDVDYLDRNNLVVYDAQGRERNPYHIRWAEVTAQNFPCSIRQTSCRKNVLGHIVFRFANTYSVYLHDTPERQLFVQSNRAISHGCVRLEQPWKLARYLMSREPRPMLLAGDEDWVCPRRPRNVRLQHPLPLRICYATCVAKSGRLRLFPDIYHFDEALRQGLFGLVP